MAIDRIPGVGPTNADIATAVAAPSAATIAAAVAAPSAATIAAAVAAPSAATIAAAVAAPSSATIASAVAAAVPTIGAINTSVATYAPSSNSWTLVASITPSSVSTVTFSSLSGYKKYKIIVSPSMTISNGGGAYLRINGDTAYGNYMYMGRYSNYQQVGWNNGSNDSSFVMVPYGAGAGAGTINGVADIDAANIAAPKYIEGRGYSYTTSTIATDYQGVYKTTSAITSITLFNPATTSNFGSGTFYLLGAN